MGSRAIIGGALAVAALVAIVLPGESGGDDASQPYPTRQVSIMAPAAPGGGWDTTARAFQKASRDSRLDDGMEVYNVEGAGGTLGLSQLVSKDSGDPYYAAKLATARFYFAKLLPETAGLIRSARAGLQPLMEMDEALF